MKTLYFLRHAKAKDISGTAPDETRPLSKRGEAEIVQVATNLKSKEVLFDHLYASDALRTTQTAVIVLETLQLKKSNMTTTSTLYCASVDCLTKLIEGIDDYYQSVLIIGHNPGLSDLANTMGNTESISLPTSAVVGFKCDAPSWGMWFSSQFECIYYDVPKSSISEAS